MENVVWFDREYRECEDCGATAVSRQIERQEFDYGVGERAVRLVADVPIWQCASCGSAYTDQEGEAVRHEAICRHLKVLTPSEVRAVRGSCSRQEFYTLTGIAEASMKRWERGEQIQTPAMDLLLRLAGDSVGACRIRDIRRQVDVEVSTLDKAPRFRTSPTREAIVRSQVFQVRKIG